MDQWILSDFKNNIGHVCECRLLLMKKMITPINLYQPSISSKKIFVTFKNETKFMLW